MSPTPAETLAQTTLPEIRLVVTALLSALEHMQAALDVLDESDAPPELAARLDMTISRTRQILEALNGDSSCELSAAED